ncbi:MAG TPA: helix-turn-helix domain-containing protein, partial [Candidatus Methylomirabilis sp.]|nr:helix-turn-helix domain-containing protein [Candidatus Methylomirabilis sp.]
LQQVAAACRVATSTVSNWTRGNAVPTALQLQDFAAACGVPPELLLAAAGVDPSGVELARLLLRQLEVTRELARRARGGWLPRWDPEVPGRAEWWQASTDHREALPRDLQLLVLGTGEEEEER